MAHVYNACHSCIVMGIVQIYTSGPPTQQTFYIKGDVSQNYCTSLTFNEKLHAHHMLESSLWIWDS